MNIKGIMDGKCGLVTGAGSGIGQAIAVTFAEAGAKVMIAGRTVSKLEETVKMIRDKGGIVEYVQCDIRDEAQVKAMIDKTVEVFGKMDFAVNNAAIDQPILPLWERDLETWKNVLDINLTGTFLCVKHEMAYMVKQNGGAICNISSGAGDVGAAGQEPYCAAKAGVNNLTKCAAQAGGPFNVRANAILPGVTMTPMVRELAQNAPVVFNGLVDAIPMGRAAEPVEQATAALFLCSDLASDVSGVWLKVDGGYQSGYFVKPR